MLRKVLIFTLSPDTRFKEYEYFNKGLIESFHRLGVECSVFRCHSDDPAKLYRELLEDPPDCTFCFNGLMPDADGNFFSDRMQIPHVACLIDPPTRFFSLLKSKYTIVTCIDRYFCDFYGSLLTPEGIHSPVLFMPHAVGHNLHEKPESPRKYDIVAMATCYDFEGAQKKWKERYSKEVCQIMNESVEITLSEGSTSYIQAFIKSLQQNGKVDPKSIDCESIYYDLETYIKGKDRIALIQAIQEQHKVHIFGGPQTNVGWDAYFPKGDSNVILHDKVSMVQAVEIMKESKIVLNSCATFKNGSHERVFLGLACGALICTNENEYLQDQFKENNGIIFYPFKDRKSINAKIKDYLEHESARCEAVNKGYAIVKAQHTWDNRVKMLQEQLPPILDRLNAI